MTEAEAETAAEGEEEERGGILGRTVGAILGVGADRGEVEEEEEEEEEKEKELEELTLDEEEEEEEEVGEEEEKEEEEAEPEEEPELRPTSADGEGIHLNKATFEQLRDLGFSVTQATRVITYRERNDGFSSLNDLDNVPGMSGSFLREVKQKLAL